jgi:hypothetical protein
MHGIRNVSAARESGPVHTAVHVILREIERFPKDSAKNGSEMPKQSGSIGASTSQTTSHGDILHDLTPKAERHDVASEFTPKKTKGL